jgi:hypothetical protein
MKLMFCQECGDLVVPYPEPEQYRFCRCKRHAVWWHNPHAGVLRIHDAAHKAEPEFGPRGAHMPRSPRAYVIGLSNMIFGFPGNMTAEFVQEMIDAHEDSYLFKRYRSLVIRIRPGESGDTGWAALPGAPELQQAEA